MLLPTLLETGSGLAGRVEFGVVLFHISPNIPSPTALARCLFASIKSENINGVTAIIGKIGLNYDIFIDNFSPITFALHQNNTPYIMRQLLSMGYDPNTIDLHNKPALYYAVEMQKYDFAIELLLWGANPNFSHNDDITPYDLAMHNNDTIMIDIFKKALVN